MPRLFSAFRVSQEAEDWLAGLQLNLYGAHWIDPSDYHVTLRFFGDIDRHQADDVMAGLRAARQVCFDAKIKGLACFGGDRPRALVAEIEAGSALADIQRAHERAALAAGLASERRNYAPHVTIARLNGTTPQAVAGAIQSFSQGLPPGFSVSEVIVFSARPGTGGGPYLEEETIALSRGQTGWLGAQAD